MALRPSNRIVRTPSPSPVVCVIVSYSDGTETIVVDVRSCRVRRVNVEIQQGAAKTFLFADNPAVDFTGATEVTFDLWRNNINGTSLLSKTYTGGDITFTDDNIVSVPITAAESLALPAGGHWLEVWVTPSEGGPLCLAAGAFRVFDRRKRDA